jgi:hypothetical protein
MISFKLMVDRDEAVVLAETYNDPDEEPALRAGTAIKNGDFSRVHLSTIFTWKTGDRGKGRITSNSDADIQEALEFAVSVNQSRLAVAALTGLHGVQIPVASAIMTAIDPIAFTVIDFRALEALGIPRKKQFISLNGYFEYLEFCKNTALEWNMSLRDLDHALWQWSKNRSKKMKK